MKEKCNKPKVNQSKKYIKKGRYYKGFDNKEYVLDIESNVLHICRKTNKSNNVVATDVVQYHPAKKQIISVVERSSPKKVGTLIKKGDDYFVSVLGIDEWFKVDPNKLEGAESYDHVLVELSQDKKEAVIKHTLTIEEKYTVQDILKQHNVSFEFSRKALKEAENVVIQKTEECHRLDLRDEYVFTVDAENAMDLDDAISIQVTESGTWLLGVHIADVAHYVKEGSVLDCEAYERGNSLYFINSSIPMLPRILSNDYCSLLPHKDRLAISIVIEIDSISGEVLDISFKESVIRSKKRLTYEGVSLYLEKGVLGNNLSEQDIEKINELYKLSSLLKENRIRRGAIEFKLPESWIDLDDDGNVLDIRKRKKTIGHQMIEECMLLTNEMIARKFSEEGIPFIYRSHKGFKSDKIDELNEYLTSIDENHFVTVETTSKEVQKMLNETEAHPKADEIRMMTLKSMGQANYSTTDSGHFGLAAFHYTHFTAPIRRYADLFNHRVLKAYIKNTLHVGLRNKWELQIKNTTEHLSKKERISKKIEVDYKLLKQVEWLKGKEDLLFIATVTNQAEGIVEIVLSNGICGFARTNNNSLELGKKVGVILKKVHQSEWLIEFDCIGLC